MIAVFITSFILSVTVIALCVGAIYGLWWVVQALRGARKRRRRDTWPRGTFGAA